jgi:tRNA (cmo5U34)-methyltransferase
MIQRSVPGYTEILYHQIGMIQRYYQPGTRIYDLGCSTGSLGISLCRQWPEDDFNMVAVDNSVPMLEEYRRRVADLPKPDRIRLICQDIGTMKFERASVIAANFTFQFLPPSHRDAMVADIFRGLAKGGILLCSEKIRHQRPGLNRLHQDVYYDFKRRNGYSELEISQKREALERVLIPETLETHIARMQKAGFDTIDIWYKWFNFAAFIAVK